MKRIMLTLVTRRRRRFGVINCRMMLRGTVLTASAAPVTARRHHQAAPVEGVGGHPAQQREQHDRPDADQPHDPQREAAPIGGHQQ
jgi:hypothetical protein